MKRTRLFFHTGSVKFFGNTRFLKIIPFICFPTLALDSIWVQLFDGKTFNNFYTYFQGKQISQNPDNDPNNICLVTNEEIIECPAGPIGYIATKRKFSKFRFKVDYRFGNDYVASNIAVRKNAGIMYHITRDAVPFPPSIESNMYFGWPTKPGNVNGMSIQTVTAPNWGTLGTANPLADTNNWNSMEIFVDGADRAEHSVNGQWTFVGQNIREGGNPVSGGNIGIQTENNDVYYRNIYVMNLVPVPGCIDSTASNFDPWANEDDGSCQPVPIKEFYQKRINEDLNKFELLRNKLEYNLSNSHKYLISIYNLHGHQVYSGESESQGEISLTPSLIPGIYFLRLKNLKKDQDRGPELTGGIRTFVIN